MIQLCPVIKHKGNYLTHMISPKKKATNLESIHLTVFRQGYKLL